MNSIDGRHEDEVGRRWATRGKRNVDHGADASDVRFEGLYTEVEVQSPRTVNDRSARGGQLYTMSESCKSRRALTYLLPLRLTKAEPFLGGVTVYDLEFG